jgi:phosphohistidine phosphatase
VNIFILRHGIAVEPGSPGISKDADRILTPKGERKIWQVADAISALEISFDIILTSPYLRARQTADIVADGTESKKRVEETDHLTPGGSGRKLLEQIALLKPPPGDVLLVGHEPYLSELIALLIAGDAPARITMRKGGLCKLSVEALQYGRCAVLEWLLTPKQMALMA